MLDPAKFSGFGSFFMQRSQERPAPRRDPAAPPSETNTPAKNLSKDLANNSSLLGPGTSDIFYANQRL